MGDGLQKAIEGLERFVEEASKPGVLGLAGKSIEKSLRRDLSGYFARLGSKLHQLAGIVEKASTKDSGRTAAEHLARMAIRRAQPQLMAALKAGYLDAVDVARRHEHVAEADQPFNNPYSPVLQDAVEWAEQNAADMVAGIDQSTIDDIADAVASGIEDQLGVAGTARSIRDLLNGWSTSRAATIAATEINRAMSWATVDMLGAQGVGYKRAIPSPGCCEDICQANVDQGAIPIDDEFDSGDDFPPFHPNCRCAVTAARGPDDDE